jgi:hypothetical protein
MGVKKLVVCGDSFMSSILYNSHDTDNGYGCHFTELLAEKIGWEVITFARGACSNRVIRLQIEEAIKIQPDCILIGMTTPDRYELPIDPDNLVPYDPAELLKNIKYSGWIDQSSENDIFLNSTPVLVSDTLNNIFVGNFTDKTLKKEEIYLLQKWYYRFHNSSWKVQQDCWAIQSGLYRLKEKGIKFYCINTGIHPCDLSSFKDSIIHWDSKLCPTQYSEESRYRFHTTLESQKVLCNLWYEKFKKDRLL